MTGEASNPLPRLAGQGDAVPARAADARTAAATGFGAPGGLLDLLGLNRRDLQIELAIKGGIAAVASVGSLISLSKGLSAWFDGRSPDVPFLLCCLALAVNYIFSQRFVARLLNSSIASITRARRDLVLRATLGNYSSILDHQRTRSFDQCQRLLEQIAVLLPGLSISANMLVLTVVAYAYFWTVSVPGALLILAGIGVLSAQHLRHLTDARKHLRAAEMQAERVSNGLGEVTRGCVEIRLGKTRRDGILDDMEDAVSRWDSLRHAHGTGVAELFSWINVFLVILSAMVVFLFPRLGIVTSHELPTLTMVLLFLIRPLAKFLNTVPDIIAAEDAARRIAEIRASLPNPEFTPMRAYDGPRRFRRIALEDVHFSYDGAAGGRDFDVGPVDLVIEPGDVIGIFGANGSGKSTVLKMIPLLLRPASGTVRLDGHPVEDADLEDYRDLFCGVFQDDHVFAALPRGPGFDESCFREMLAFLEIDHLVRVGPGGRLDYTLSRGQRRRLALATAVAENRPIIILDEWTADQDQTYRLRFKAEILKLLKERGLTVIFVSHDENAVDACTSSIFMSRGRMTAPQSTGDVS